MILKSNMEEENKVGLTENWREMLLDFREVCRFCLSEAKNGLSVSETFLSGESEGREEESVCGFVTKLSFVKMEDLMTFPFQICKNCHQIIQLCYDFGEMCKKSNKILQDWSERRLKQIGEGVEESNEKSTIKDCQLGRKWSAITTETNQLKTEKIKSDVIGALSAYKQKLVSLSENIKKFPPNCDKNSKETANEHSCSQCSLAFTNQGALNFHQVATHCQRRFRTLLKFQCKNCSKLFTNEEKLKRHYKSAHNITEIPDEYLNCKVRQLVQMEKKKFFCFHCVPYVEFHSQDKLTEHLENSHKMEPSKAIAKQYLCAYCSDLTFPNKVRLREHLQLVHNLKGDEITWKDVKCIQKPPQVSVVDILDSLNVAEGVKISCKKCNPQMEFGSVKEFAQHIRNHLEGKQDKEKPDPEGLKCPDCKEAFPTNRQLILHGINTHQKYFAYYHKVFKKILQPEEENGERVKNFECDICQRKYIYKSSLRKHILSVHLGKTGSDGVVCPYCGKKISNKLNLKSHIEFVHEALFVSCPICKKKINFRTIGKHYKTHRTGETVDSKNSYLCNLCGKLLKSRRSFEDHQKLHKNIRDELCDICGRGFTTKKFLRLHKKTHEAGERPKAFGCDQCEKVFSGKHTLNRHLLTHSGKKNFICEICSKCFYTLQELNRHVRYHKKEYRFDCQLCDMKFLDKSRFRHHMMRHRNVRPHKCRFCEKMFIVRGKMNLHMATKHNFEVENAKGVWKDPQTYVPLDDLL